MPYEFVDMAEGIVEGAISLGSMRSFLGLVSYVFCALSLYTMAERRGIRKAWLAWIPVVNVWILGSLSDQYRYVVKGEVRSRRKVLLSVNILSLILSVASVIRVVVTLVLAVSGMAQGIGEQVLLETLAHGLVNGLIFYIPTLILGLVGLIFEIIALYDVYSSCDPANNVLYLILSVIPGVSSVTRPLFLFLCRDKDGGMPPRRETVAEEPAEF